MKIKQLAHIVLGVEDLDQSAAWYRDMFDMEVVGESERFKAVFLSFGARDHDIALMECKDVGKTAGREVHHLALEFDGSLDAYKAALRKLKEDGVSITATVDHGVAYGIYCLDPNGHTIELYFSTLDPGTDAPAAFRKTGVLADPIDIEALEG